MAEEDRLRWRCRRGMRELDVLLCRYLDLHYASAPADEQAAFRHLLETPDPELFALFMGRAQPQDEAQQSLVSRICQGV